MSSKGSIQSSVINHIQGAAVDQNDKGTKQTNQSSFDETMKDE